MFSNFKDTFIKKPKFTTQIPQSVLDMLSHELPEGFQYVNDHDGFCRIDCNDTMNFEDMRFQIPKEAKPIFEKLDKITINDIIAYAQNTQTNIEILPDSDGNFTVNGEKININKFIIAPLKGIQLKDKKLYIMALPFPAPFPIEVAGNGFSLTLMVQRQVINSITKIKIGTVSKSALNLNYTFDSTEEGKLTLNITTSPSSSASDILASKEIFNAFIRGEGTLCDAKISSNKNNIINLIPDEVIQFWHQIVDVEKALNIKFDVSQDISLDDIKLVKELYRSFVENLPFRTNLKDITLRGVGEFYQNYKNVVEIGKEILFEYTETVENNLLGVSIKYYRLTCIFGGAVSDIWGQDEGVLGDFFIKLCKAEGKKMYSSTLCFLDENELETFRKDRKNITDLKAATELE